MAIINILCHYLNFLFKALKILIYYLILYLYITEQNTFLGGKGGKIMKRRQKKRTALFSAILTILMTAVLLGGCGAKSAVTAETAAAYEVAAEEAAAEMPAMAAVNYDSGAAPAEGAADESEQNSSAPMNPLAGRKLIRNVHMSVETDSFDALLSGISSRIAELGGYIEQSDISGEQTNYRNEPIPRDAYLTARIPSAKLDSFVDFVSTDGNVTNKSESTQDVTLQYSDIESKKKSLTIEQDRIWALLEKADTLESVIALEQRLSEIRYELESMESQLRLYDNQVDYSTVTLSIHEVTVFTPTAPETIGQRISSGFQKSLENVADFCVNLIVGIAATSPIWIPVGILALILFFVYKRRTWKKRFMKGNAESYGITADNNKGAGEDK